MPAITICKGATISAAEVARIEAAMKQLVEDNGAAHQLSVTVTLHNHNEYPKMVYKGKESKTVLTAEEESAAKKLGFGAYDHKAFTAKEA